MPEAQRKFDVRPAARPWIQPELVTPDATEVLAGSMVGYLAGRRRLPRTPSGATRRRLDDVLTEALATPPCAVSFSGGRDSSVILAVATSIARREGLDLPIPVTLRFDGIVATDESPWQTLVIEHLGLVDWERIDDVDADIAGPTAMKCLAAIGPHFPANGYLHHPMLSVARGGTLVAGIGGDEVFLTPAATWLRLLAGHAPFTRATLRAALADISGDIDRADARRAVEALPWLRRPAVEMVLARMLRTKTPRSRWGLPAQRLDTRLRTAPLQRYYAAAYGTLRAIGDLVGTRVVTPFFEPEVLAAIAADLGAAGRPNRSAAMLELFGDVLPRSLLERPTKASFGRATSGHRLRAFADGWHGQGIAEELVDVESLRAAWLSPDAPFPSLALLQQALLSTGWVG